MSDIPLPPGTRIVRLGAVFFLDPTTHHESHAVVAEEGVDGTWYRGTVVCPLHPDLIPDLIRDHSFVI
ncbi:MAG: hypothetical protein KBD06_04585 [Candidatus Pacebacteria bacterium]|nr:hypothetical protein [Candidatus Paceibacterota bacterium]